MYILSAHALTEYRIHGIGSASATIYSLRSRDKYIDFYDRCRLLKILDFT